MNKRLMVYVRICGLVRQGMIAQVIATLRYDDRVPHQSLRQHSEVCRRTRCMSCWPGSVN